MLIIGLGNPGGKYEATRHNIGFMVMDLFAGRHGISFKEGFRGLYASEVISGARHYFLKPLTYMNLSGEAAGELCRYYKIPPEEVIAVYDELDYAYGVMKLHKGGSAGGHNGIKSLIQHLGTENFGRVRMGIAGMHRSKIRGYTADYVLAPFTAAEREILPGFLERGADAVEMAVKEGFTPAMNKFNKIAREQEKLAKAAEQAEAAEAAEEK